MEKFVPEVEHVTFSGQMAWERGQIVSFVMERSANRLLADGLTVTEIAPGVDIARDFLGRVEIPLRVSPTLRQMDERVLRPEPMGLTLRQTGESHSTEVLTAGRERVERNGRA
jgi:acyl CoA:acetate/3-ketoacid CoA transferase